MAAFLHKLPRGWITRDRQVQQVQSHGALLQKHDESMVAYPYTSQGYSGERTV